MDYARNIVLYHNGHQHGTKVKLIDRFGDAKRVNSRNFNAIISHFLRNWTIRYRMFLHLVTCGPNRFWRATDECVGSSFFCSSFLQVKCLSWWRTDYMPMLRTPRYWQLFASQQTDLLFLPPSLGLRSDASTGA